MNFYSLSLLLPPKNEEEWGKILEGVVKEIEKLGGKFGEKFLEKKKFAYPVKKQTHGAFGEILFELDGKKVKLLSETLKHNPEILRFMIEKKKAKKPVKIKKKEEKIKLEEIEKKFEELLK